MENAMAENLINQQIVLNWEYSTKELQMGARLVLIVVFSTQVI